MRASHSKWVMKSTLCFAAVAMIVLSQARTNAWASVNLQVTSEQIFMMPEANHQGFRLLEVLAVQNPSTATADVQIGLPAGYEDFVPSGIRAQDVTFQRNLAILQHVAKPNAITMLTVSFVVPLHGQLGVQLTLHNDYPVYAAHLYLPIDGVALSAQSLLATTQTTSISGTTFRVFTRLGIPSGDDWRMGLQWVPNRIIQPSQLNGLPLLGAGGSNTGNTLQAVGNLLLAAFVLTIGLIGVRSIEWTPTRQTQISKREALFRAWETIEHRFADGSLSLSEHDRLRREIMTKIRGLPSIEGGGGNLDAQS